MPAAILLWVAMLGGTWVFLGSLWHAVLIILMGLTVKLLDPPWWVVIPLCLVAGVVIGAV